MNSRQSDRSFSRCTLISLLTVLALTAAPRTWGDEKKSAGYECTITAVTCGAGVTTATETAICGVVELTRFGKLPDKSYVEVKFFAGYRIGSEVLILGGASAKAGVEITCKIPWDDQQNKPDYGRLKEELPQILKANPTIKERFPDISKIEIDKRFSFEKLKPAETEAVKKAYPAEKPK